MYTSSSARRRTNWFEVILWILIFLLVYILPSSPHLAFQVEGIEGLIPQLPAASTWISRLVGLLALALISTLAIYTGERYLLIEKGERATMVLFFVALMATSPSLGALSGLAVIFLQLILFLSFGLYQDTHQPRGTEPMGATHQPGRGDPRWTSHREGLHRRRVRRRALRSLQ